MVCPEQSFGEPVGVDMSLASLPSNSSGQSGACAPAGYRFSGLSHLWSYTM